MAEYFSDYPRIKEKNTGTSEISVNLNYPNRLDSGAVYFFCYWPFYLKTYFNLEKIFLDITFCLVLRGLYVKYLTLKRKTNLSVKFNSLS